jgi:hypothetical protein
VGDTDLTNLTQNRDKCGAVVKKGSEILGFIKCGHFLNASQEDSLRDNYIVNNNYYCKYNKCSFVCITNTFRLCGLQNYALLPSTFHFLCRKRSRNGLDNMSIEREGTTHFAV